MQQFLRWALPVYFVVYFGIVFVWKTVVIARRIGKNPLVFPKDDSAYALTGRYFKMLLAVLFLYVLLFAFFPAWHGHFLPLTQLNKTVVQYTGLLLLLVALIWTVVAQNEMRNSWRIGIDTDTKTELVTTGLFSRSRNPVFFGMSLLGLFLVTPNAVTVLFLVLGYVLIQIQIRLEEAFLARRHGQSY